MTTPDDKRIERLALHLGLTTMMLQSGTPLSLLQQQLVTLRAAAKDVIDIEDLSANTRCQQVDLIPESLAEELQNDLVVPDDIGDLDL